MKMSFVGGVRFVGGLGMLLESGSTRLMFDYGVIPKKPPGYPRKVQFVDGLYISHSHLDHVGMIPWLTGEYGTSNMGTEVTLEVATVLLEDSLKISKLENHHIPWGINDLRRYTEETEPIRYGQSVTDGPFEIKAHDAGHIPGSTMYSIEENGRKTLFTGDINTLDTRLLKGASPVDCDVLVIESTYAGRRHPPRKTVEREFLDKIEEVLDRGGRVVIPAFAVGRTQEIVQVLSAIDEEKWLDGMGRRVAKIYLRHPEFISNPGKLKRAMDSMRFVKTPNQRNKACEAPLVVTTSGMLDGGPVLEYVNRIKNDPRSAVLLTGYQVEDTNGRMLKDTGHIEIGGAVERVDCEVAFFDFSAHSDHAGIVDFARATGAEDVILIHGDNREAIKEDIEQFARVHLPDEDVVFDL
ncbi:MAG: MBL fold metallo-hydrolase [Candidatus Thermoplasmatota archaeon]|nr:MBL fold metallo-hydrolase [Candidatus Thermoplasmatota archaeon]